ncbi:hypothetical protein [Enterocloster lavalensis]|uniref:hypothetical protein n=1 Tax=Enterocloster lavalensis TaxID=460384 RepID=UPI0023F292E5|nr:hypothetical protein [Enterocloster lavalensis]
MRKVKKSIIFISIFCVIFSAINEKYHLIVTSYADMIGYQFNFFTISTVMAGFSFTSLGTLLGLSSETLMEKLKNTTIIINKSQRIVGSLLCFCGSGLISLFFVIGLDSLLSRTLLKIGINNWQVIINFIFLLGLVFLGVGIVYFIWSVYEIYDLIVRIYSCNAKKYQAMEIEYKEEIEKAMQRHSSTDASMSDEFNKE